MAEMEKLVPNVHPGPLTDDATPAQVAAWEAQEACCLGLDLAVNREKNNGGYDARRSREW